MSFFFFNDTATTEIYTLSLHDALPISALIAARRLADDPRAAFRAVSGLVLALFITTVAVVGITTQDTKDLTRLDRKSTRLNSSHGYISYAVFCLKKNMRQYGLLLTGFT